MKRIWELEETVDGYRVNIWPENVSEPIYKINPETKLEALQVLLRDIQEKYLEEKEKFENTLA